MSRASALSLRVYEAMTRTWRHLGVTCQARSQGGSRGFEGVRSNPPAARELSYSGLTYHDITKSVFLRRNLTVFT